MNNQFSTEVLDLPAMIEVVERDFPGWAWWVARCHCGAPEGDYTAALKSPDYEEGFGLVIDMSTGQMTPLQGRGHLVGSHGKTAALALAAAYGKAMEVSE